jgi:signal transduction histidine kinase
LPAWLEGKWGWLLAGTTVYCAVYVAWTFLHWGDEAWRLLIADAGYLPVSLLAAIACGSIWRDTNLDPALRRAWGFICLALFSNFVGDLLWFNYEVIQKTSPFPSWADLGYLGYYPLVMLGVLSFRFAPISRADRHRHSLDVTIILVASSMAIWYFQLAPNADVFTFSLDSALLVSYQLIDLMIIYALAVFITRRPDLAWQNGFGFLLMAMVLFVAGDVVYGIQNTNGTYVSGDPLDITWLLSYLCFICAARIQYTSHKSQNVPPPPNRSLSLLYLLPYAMLVLELILTCYAFYTNDTITLEVRGLFVGSLILTVLVAIRQILDLQENRRLNTELTFRLKQLEETGQALDRAQHLAGVGTLAAGVAHEINNPMGVIVAATEMLQKRLKNNQWNREAFETNLGRIERSAWHITKIVGSLLTYARGTELVLKPTTAKSLIEDAIFFTHLTPDAAVDIQVQVMPETPSVICDADKITQVLVNLIANACDAVQETPLPRQIVITANGSPADGLRVTVTDNGPGLSAEVLARAFDPFFTTKPVGKGTGLGLSICRGIVVAHGGQLQLTSTPGHGATAEMILPLQPINNPA